MIIMDKLSLNGTRRTNDGYMTAIVKVARTGVQEYLGREVGKPEMPIVRVYRPDTEVMSRDTLHSFAHRPITVDHPSTPVNATNWKKLSVGSTGGEVDGTDGRFVQVPIAVMDSEAITEVESGKRELSMGYTCDISFEDGISPDGLPYDAVQRNIRANHLAIVSSARGGPELRIGDNNVSNKIIVVDGHNVEVSDAAAIAITGLQNKLNTLQLVADGATAKDNKIGQLVADGASKDAKIVELERQLADAAITPAKLDAAIAARSVIVDGVKKVDPSFDASGKTELEMKRYAVSKSLGDSVAATLNDAAIDGAFLAVVSKTVADSAGPTAKIIASSPNVVNITDSARMAEEAHAKMVASRQQVA